MNPVQIYPDGVPCTLSTEKEILLDYYTQKCV